MLKINKNEKGITLIALAITMIVMVIIATISIYEGKQLITKAKVQTLETNMLAVKAKAKAYAEEIDAQVWNAKDKQAKRQEKFSTEKGMDILPTDTDFEGKDQVVLEIGNNYEAYEVTTTALDNMDLQDLKQDIDGTGFQYIVVYNSDDFSKIDVVYTGGVKYQGYTYYTLSELLSVLGEE